MLLDSTGIKFLGGQWRKLPSGIDAQTLQVRAICVTSNNVSDAVVVLHLWHNCWQMSHCWALPVMVPMTHSLCMPQ